ncbi:unnamed protein product [Spirodela intermedia]|uniref:Uncharacterized protein n=2 Tax=Spirodela intermedia TaxID=51605 RepID=A0A7I8K116_SPIIN|nr:unnamed protein product [Spirodela intermedia]CAA6654776.1 unnamed protein product [Spirodela intermedia]CAA7389444.1 unnamed protein product [Spirodela intermedia]
MGLRVLRALVRPLAITRRLSQMPSLPLPQGSRSGLILKETAVCRPAPFHFPWAASGVVAGSGFHSLTDTRFPKRRPGFAPRRKRASLRPPGPYAWVQHAPGEPTPSSQPNRGSIKARGRKAKKRIKQVKAFILSEKKKRQAQYTESRKKKNMEKIERKMAAVAREKAWAQRLVELQQLEAAKRSAMAS